MSAELELHASDGGFAPERLPWWELLRKAADLVDAVGRTEFVGSGLRGKPAAAVAAIMYGAELNIDPMTSLNKLNVIDGHVAPSAELARALAMQRGELWVEEETDQRVVVAARRFGSDVVHRVAWSMEDARRAGLATRTNWKLYPREMLYARATAMLVRRVFPDVLGGISVFAEEVDGPGPTPGVDEPTPSERAPVRKAKRGKPPALPAAPHRHDMAQIADETPAEAAVSAAEPEADPTPLAPTDEPLRPTAPPVDDDLRQLVPEDAVPRTIRRPTPATGKAPPTKMATDRAHAMFRALGLGDDRDTRLAIVRYVVGRPIESTSELDADEVSKLLDVLAAVERRPGILTIDEDGLVNIDGIGRFDT